MGTRYLNTVALILLASSIVGCDKESAISKAGIVNNDNFKLEGNIAKNYVKPGAQNSNFGGYIDIVEGKVFTSDEVKANFEAVDLYYRYTENGHNELISTSFEGNVTLDRELELVHYAWPYNNRTEMYIVKSSDVDQLGDFEKINTIVEIKAFAESIKNFGSTTRTKTLRRITKGDMILVVSASKSTTTIAKVLEVANATNGRLSLSTKSDISTKKFIAKQSNKFVSNGKPADTLTLSIGASKSDENFVDLLNRKVYKASNLPNGSVATVTAVHVSNGTRQSFFGPNSSFLGSNYDAQFYNWFNLFGNRKSVTFWSLDVNPGSTDLKDAYQRVGLTFEQLPHNNESLKEYHNAIGLTSPNWSHATTLVKDMILRVADNTGGYYGIVKILEIDNVNRTLKIALKFSVPEKD